MSNIYPKTRLRILVTGSRGKSSVVRLLHCVLHAAGLHTYARITGIVPRELGPNESRTILRSSNAHVEEMRWWLGQLPATTEAIVLENSAITPELQGLAGRWLKPDLTILTNIQPDHQEIWGPTRICAAEVLTAGLPRGSLVVLPSILKTENYLLKLIDHRACQPVFAEPATGVSIDYRASNMGLALAAVKHLQLPEAPAMQAMLDLQRDKYDFHLINYAGAELAMAFSANDISSTRRLFRSLLWPEQDTRLIYNHRKDRPERLRSFLHWLTDYPWREVLIIGDKPNIRFAATRYLKVKNEDELIGLFHPGDRIFGCGNITGLPQSLAVVPD